MSPQFNFTLSSEFFAHGATISDEDIIVSDIVIQAMQILFGYESEELDLLDVELWLVWVVQACIQQGLTIFFYIAERTG